MNYLKAALLGALAGTLAGAIVFAVAFAVGQANNVFVLWLSGFVGGFVCGRVDRGVFLFLQSQKEASA